jgi:hypothetical protein
MPAWYAVWVVVAQTHPQLHMNKPYIDTVNASRKAICSVSAPQFVECAAASWQMDGNAIADRKLHPILQKS